MLFLFVLTAYAGAGVVKGKIQAKGETLPGCFVQIKGMNNKAAISDGQGNYIIKNVPEGNHTLVVSTLGFHTANVGINIKANKTTVENVTLEEDLLDLDEVVVSGTRNQVAVYKAPVIVSRISPKLFETTQSLSLSEGLAFSPGLRVETNCQNCGFSQLRMNGLEGAYSQILINSRPVYSALVGVYGLDMIPSNMIERIEVVKGGGSAMYGGNAIGGTVNVITKDPINDSFQFDLNQAYTDMEASDRTISVNGNIVSEDLNKGISIFASNKNRKPWDANDDGFTELTEIHNNTFGFDAFWNTSEKSKLKINMNSINEFRRGGNKLHLQPHEADITEQLDHKILGGGLSFERYSSDYKHKFAVYTSLQDTKRKSYYGTHGRMFDTKKPLSDDDITALNSYGHSKDISSASGLQYSYDINKMFTLSAGGEYKMNEVNDAMPGYGRTIEQKVNTLGSYAQLEIKPIEALTLLVGGRYDHVDIDGTYSFQGENFDLNKPLNVFVPRFSAMYDVTKKIKLRASYAQGYRGPQAFDEDLHIEAVGGESVFVQLSPNLKTEKSDNITASFNYSKSFGDFQTNIVVEGFHTTINNPFFSQELKKTASGVWIRQKKNGDALKVLGGNIEMNFAYTKKFLAQLGLTVQKSKLNTPEAIWEPADDYKGTNKAIFTDKILRTPDVYGFFSFSYKPVEALTLSWSGVYTGAMDVAHVVGDGFDDEYTMVQRTPTFLENNFKVAYDIDFDDNNCLILSAGIQNAFNSFQKDFDKGIDRDPGYIYGPRRPRTVFFNLKYSFSR